MTDDDTNATAQGPLDPRCSLHRTVEMIVMLRFGRTCQSWFARVVISRGCRTNLGSLRIEDALKLMLFKNMFLNIAKLKLKVKIY